MKNNLKIASILYILFFHSVEVLAQKNIEDTINGSTTKLIIPHLSQLIDSALVHSGMVSYRRLEIDAKESNLKSKRRYWTRNFGVQADTRYGTFNNFSTTSGSNSTINLASNTKQLNYNVGFYLKIPIFDVINRKSQIKKAKAELAQAAGLAKSQESEVRTSVIRHYEDLKLKQNILELRASNLGSARVNMEMVAKEFRNGAIETSEYVRISDMTSRIAVEFEKAKSAFFLSKKLLENQIGFQLK
jgi:outer membrane protein TolC